MSRVTSSVPDRGSQGLQPHVSENGLGTNYARLEREYMGTSQQLGNSLRKSDAGEPQAGRELLASRGTAVRNIANNVGTVPPVVQAHGARTSSKPPSTSLGSVFSPRHPSCNSYRDAALVAAQHGLSAYAQSAVAAAGRTHASRAGATAGRPPPVPRPTQHSAPTPSSFQPLSSEFLPTCSVASPSRAGGIPPSRGGLLPSRGSAPTPGSVHRNGDAVPASAQRSSETIPLVTVTYNDTAWPAHGDGGAAAAYPTYPQGSSAGARVMSPGWGTSSPSVYEADGRPGTRGGGPQYDIDGRPTTRGGQRPPSRAQLNLSLGQQRPPAHVAPLGGPGWAGLFAAGSATGPGEVAPSGTTSPRLPSGGGGGSSTSWSGEVIDNAGPHRRQLIPLHPSASAAAFGAGGGGGAGPGVGGGAAGFSPPSGPRALAPRTQALHGAQVASHLPDGAASRGQGSVGSNGSYSPGSGRPYSSKLSSIAEAPGSPSVAPKGLVGRLDGTSGRKASRERTTSGALVGMAVPDGLGPSFDRMSEEAVHDDSYFSYLDQDGSGRGGARTRPRSTPDSMENGHSQQVTQVDDQIGAVSGSAEPSSPTFETPATRPRR